MSRISKPVAIIGTSFRFPGCQSQTFTEALFKQQDLITEVDNSRWNKSTFLHPDPKNPGTSYTFASGSLGDISGFDASFFGLSPREVLHMDPQQRLLLEMTWEAMENAGYAPSSLRGSSCGVYMGVASIDYGFRYHDDLGAIDQNTGTGTTASISSNRLSYLFDLKGPSLTVDTACSSSLVAFHHACEAIRRGEVPIALTGGISLHFHPYGFLAFAKASMLSKQGRCRVFDASADGYVRSEGGGVLLLKDYEKALEDGDDIIAVVAGSAANADGYKSALTIPNADAQIALMQQAYQAANITPDQISYVEAHGTGTPVGDPIEAKAIGEALGRKRQKPLSIGSVKSNVGHLETASGMAGIAKALISIQHRKIPATIGIKQLNPAIPFDELNLNVVTENQELPSEGTITVGVNSFGFGGANAHVILQSYPEKSDTTPSSIEEGANVPLWISARSRDALKQRAQQISDLLLDQPQSLYDVAWTLRYHRERHNMGAWVVGSDAKVLSEELALFTSGESNHQVHETRFAGDQEGPVFVYSGNGCQWAGMGASLLHTSPRFNETIRQVDQYYAKYADTSLIDLINTANSDTYKQTELAQPALFAIQVGITQLLFDAGIVPKAVTGHSVGEVAAAWASGALTLEQAVDVICYRSFYQGKTAGEGQMTAVACSVEQAETLLGELAITNVCIAGINSKNGITLAGDIEALSQIEQRLKVSGIRFKRLDLNYAFHSPAMNPIQDGLKASLESLKPSASSRCSYFSTVTGSELEGEALTADYWWKNIREPVMFYPVIKTLMQTQGVFVEIGAHPVLSGYLKEIVKSEEVKSSVLLSTMTRDAASASTIDTTVASLWTSGAMLNWHHFFPVVGNKIALPDYPWQRESFAFPSTREGLHLLTTESIHPLLGRPSVQFKGVWENKLDTQAYPWLAEHQIGQAVLFPGSGFIELALSASYHHQHRSVLDIEELEIRSPMLLVNSPAKKVRTRLLTEQGHISIESRDVGSDDEYTLHVKCRMLPETAGLDLIDSLSIMPDRAADFTLADLQSAATAAGLYYGESFQCIAEGWVENQQIIGRVEKQGDAEVNSHSYLIHPGVLDSAFQLVMALLYLEGDTDVVYVPIQVGRVQLLVSDESIAFVKVSLKRQLPHSLLMDVSLYDQQGATLGYLQDVRMRAAVIRQTGVQAIDQIKGYLTPAPFSNSVQVASQLDIYQQQFDQVLNQSSSYQAYALEVEPLLDTFAEQILRTVVKEDNPDCPFVRIAKRFDIDATLDADIDPESIWSALLHDYPAHFALAHYLGRLYRRVCVDHEKQDVTLDGAIANVEDTQIQTLNLQQVYTQLLRIMLSETAHHQLANVIQESVQALTDALTPGQRLSVCEIAGGDPWWAPWIHDQLNKHLVDYTCVLATDFASSVEAILKAKLPELECVMANDWFAQGFAQNSIAGKVDLAIITLDFADLSVAKEVLQTLHQRLSPSGEALIFINHPALWIDCVLGTDPDWWVSSSQTQQASWSQWQELLNTLGYALTKEEPEHLLQTGMFAVRAKRSDEQPVELMDEGKVSQDNELPRFFIIGDHSPVQLINQLEALDCTVTFTNNAESLKAMIQELPIEQQCEIVFMPPCDQSALVKACIDLHQLALKLIEVAAPERIALRCVTQGVSGMFELDQPEHSSTSQNRDMIDTPITNAAAIWGFARTLMNELSQMKWQLIDISRSTLDIECLVSEIMQDIQETEVVYEQSGGRYAVRFRPLEKKLTKRLPDNHALTLGFTLPGQLRNLTWTSKRVPALEPQQVLVKVKATGLNFRDVMYALGLLSDEAIENGYSGPSLGLEFSGEVLAVGEQVQDYKPGDAVVGFGPASFSTQLIAHVSAISPIPEGISFEAAATIPTTFFTAWYSLKQLAQLEEGERILIHGAAGGVGIAAIQIAQILGAEVYATAGSDEKRDFLAMMGVEHIFDSRSHVYAEQILHTTPDGQGVDVVLNSLAGEAIAQNLRVLKPFGRFLELGKRDFYENTPMGLRPFRNNISYFGIDSDQLMKVKPELTEKLFKEVMHHFNTGDLYPLPYTLFTAERVEEAFRFMQQARQIGKIVVTYPREPEAKRLKAKALPSIELNAEGIYLVAGGLSGFGFKTAQWLVEKGAKALCLISRSGQVSEEVANTLQHWQQSGIQVLVKACDIVDADSLATTIQEAEKIGPIVGVVHAAAVYDDALATQLTPEQIQRVMSVKVQGAVNLHQLTQNLELFVLFSSATTLFGNPGQSHYVAANYWLEALAAYRRKAGAVATCVNWGPIDDVGYLARQTQVKEHLENRMGTAALNSDDALALMEQYLIEKESGVHTLNLDWGSMSRVLPTASEPKFKTLNRLVKNKGHEGDEQAEIKALIDQGDFESVEAMLLAILTKELSNILLMPENKIDPLLPIYDMGFDSLMAAELMAAIDSRLGVQLPAMALNDSLTLSRLSALIMDKLNPNSDNSDGTPDNDAEAAFRAKHGVEETT